MFAKYFSWFWLKSARLKKQKHKILVGQSIIGYELNAGIYGFAILSSNFYAIYWDGKVEIFREETIQTVIFLWFIRNKLSQTSKYLPMDKHIEDKIIKIVVTERQVLISYWLFPLLLKTEAAKFKVNMKNCCQ